MSAPTRDTSITVARGAIGDYAQDIQTRSWILPTGVPGPSIEQIRRYSQFEVAKLLRLPHGWDGGRGAPLHPALANVALNLVAALTTRSGLATPQFSPSTDGGLDIVWLVAGNRLTASLDLEGISLYATWADGGDAFPRFEYNRFERLEREFEVAVMESATFLD
jgi:hypothetical protein